MRDFYLKLHKLDTDSDAAETIPMVMCLEAVIGLQPPAMKKYEFSLHCQYLLWNMKQNQFKRKKLERKRNENLTKAKQIQIE